VFSLNADLYPESANVWDSLAESYWKSGNAKLAIKYYEKAIDLDPNGRTGENATRMLEEIRSHQ
jgi:tetratricopeptide (TPR) repeat protein